MSALNNQHAALDLRHTSADAKVCLRYSQVCFENYTYKVRKRHYQRNKLVICDHC
ncbi:hypothetical protein Mapa_013330 [Marchantia paleacea]|nr:hypothetical protein Mapa_013330 [Marchantia paleacea]